MNVSDFKVKLTFTTKTLPRIQSRKLEETSNWSDNQMDLGLFSKLQGLKNVLRKNLIIAVVISVWCDYLMNVF